MLESVCLATEHALCLAINTGKSFTAACLYVLRQSQKPPEVISECVDFKIFLGET